MDFSPGVASCWLTSNRMLPGIGLEWAGWVARLRKAKLVSGDMALREREMEIPIEDL